METKTAEELRNETDANIYIDRAIEMMKDVWKPGYVVAGWNGVMSLLQYAKESHAAQFRPAALPDDLKEWIEGEAEAYASEVAPWNEDRPDPNGERQREWQAARGDFVHGATAMYNLLSPKLVEQEKEVNEANRQCLHAQQQGLKMLEKFNYWKQRCEAAEEMSRLYSEWQACFVDDAEEQPPESLEAFDKFIKSLQKWEELKKLNSDKNDERSVATEDDSSTGADKQKID